VRRAPVALAFAHGLARSLRSQIGRPASQLPPRLAISAHPLQTVMTAGHLVYEMTHTVSTRGRSAVSRGRRAERCQGTVSLWSIAIASRKRETML